MFQLSVSAIKSQLAANFEMVSDIVQRCPEEFWISSVEDHVIGRIIYHGLFYIDFIIMILTQQNQTLQNNLSNLPFLKI